MSRDRTVADLTGIIERLDRRIFALESKLSNVIDERHLPGVFSFAGFDFVGVESPAWRPIHTVEVVLVVAQVLIASIGGDMTIDLTLYGPTTGVIRTLTIPDGKTYSEDAVPFVIPQGGALTAKVTSSVTASDLSIALDARLI